MMGSTLLPDDWPPYLVVAIGRDDTAGEGHDHVLDVETRDPDGGETRWAGQEVIAAIRDGERFVLDAGDDAESELRPAACPGCSRTTLLAVPTSVPPRGG